MSKRYGRNQKRAHRAKVEAEAMVSVESSKKIAKRAVEASRESTAQYRHVIDSVERDIGYRSGVFAPTEIDQYMGPQYSVIPQPRLVSMYEPCEEYDIGVERHEIPISQMRVVIDKMTEWGQKTVHVTFKPTEDFSGARSHYALSPEMIKNLRRYPQAMEHIAQAIIGTLVNHDWSE